MGAQSLGSRAILGRMFLRLQQGPAGWVDRLSFQVDSDQASEEHRWLGMSPQMREWVGGRLVHGLRDQGITIENVDYEGSIEIKISEIERDKTGQIMARVDGLADRANSHGAKLLSDLVIAGASEPCYDGQFFFDTDHAEGDSGAQSNDISQDLTGFPIETVAEKGTPTAPSPRSMSHAILQSIQQMYGFKDDQGEPLNEMASEFLVMVPTSFWASAITAATKQSLASGEDNALVGAGVNVTVIANPRLSWTDKFVTFRADQGDGVKPFIKQVEKKLDVKAQAEGSAEEFYNNRHVYGIDWRGAFGYGFWQHAVLSTLIAS